MPNHRADTDLQLMRTKENSLTPTHFISQTSHTINYVAKNTSCSRGWLHVVVQTIFGTITVASFSLIIIMSLQRAPVSHKKICNVDSCIVTCSKPNYYGDDIVTAVMEADMECDKIKLVLEQPKFKNGIMPANWLNDLPVSIDQLFISGGNLKYIVNNAFINTFATKLKILGLEDIEISSWSSLTLAGLSNLETLSVSNSTISNIHNNTLEAIRDNIETIVITGCGRWNPIHLTGTTNLTKLGTVNFANNVFGNVLSTESFKGLEFCQYLYLNSCNLTFIPTGAFDHFKIIKMLFLNDNFLINIEYGLFDHIIHIQSVVRTRIDLQNNNWFCDCDKTDIRKLIDNELLSVDPVCTYPKHLEGTTFSTLVDNCRNTTDYKELETVDMMHLHVCRYGSDSIVDFPVQLVSPLPEYACPVNEMRNSNVEYLTSNNNETTDCSWLKSALFVRQRGVSMLQVATSNNISGHGLMWYNTECPNEVYCFNFIPSLMTLYSTNLNSQYTFLRVNLFLKSLVTEKCAFDNVVTPIGYEPYHIGVLFNICIGFICLFVGAILVYGIIRMNPYLLKGSKRILFVKHRTVDAIILPPKVPARKSLDKQYLVPECSQGIFTVSHDQNLLHPNSFLRSFSVRSDKSSSPTYVSAMQPTEAQLAEWRLMHHFHKNASIISLTSDMSFEYDNNIYDNIPYESLK